MSRYRIWSNPTVITTDNDRVQLAKYLGYKVTSMEYENAEK